MDLTVTEKMDIIRDTVEGYFNRNFERVVNSNGMVINPETHKDDIINIGTSILCTKWKIAYSGGSFVQAIVNNDLTGAISSADSTNIRALKFYVMLFYNVGLPHKLLNVTN